MKRRLLIAAVLSACALVAAGCGGADGSAPAVSGHPISLAELTRSARTSADAASGRFAFEVRTELPGGQGPLSFSGEGAFDKASDRASFSVDMSALAKLLGGLFTTLGGTAAKPPGFGDPAGWKIDVVEDGKVAYVRFPALADRLPAGKSWIRSDGKRATVDGLQLEQLEGLASADPRSVLEVLHAIAGDVETVGTEVLRGTETTHYRATVDPREIGKLASTAGGGDVAPLAGQAAAGVDARPIPVDVWLDGAGLVRKLALSISSTKAVSSQGGSASMSFELWDYGTDVGIDLPAAGEVVDARSLER